MIHINKNVLLTQLQNIIKKDETIKYDYLPDSFNKKQSQAFETFKKRIQLEEIIEETIAFNKSLSWNHSNENLMLTTTAEELIQVFKLRSDVFKEIGYQNEFPDTIEGLNFDKFDKTSALIYYKNNKEISGTIRLIFDSKNNLPSEKIFSFDKIRKKNSTIGEISRNIVKNRGLGLNQEFKYLMSGIYNIFTNNNIDIALSGIKKEHLKLFKKLGGVEVVKELNTYGSFENECLIISYNPKFASKFFKKVFLN